MFASSPAFSSFAVDDLDAARTFYSDTLGLSVEDLPMAGGLLSVGISGSRNLMLYPVDDIDAAVDGLTDAGVSLERYDGFDQDDKGIARSGPGPMIAWFRDPAGNILAVLQQD
jgi:predicted enzyme related to lactoylglutathione lyase